MSLAFDASSVLSQAIQDCLAVIDLRRDQPSVLQGIAEEMTRAILAGKKILWCGNGGSAADSQHLAAELMGRFRRDRCVLASIALKTDISILTAVGNDYGYKRIFQRQVEALCTKGDALVGLAVSGASQNVCAALQTARQIGAFMVAFTGQGGGE